MEELSAAGPFKSTTKPVKRGRGRPRGSRVKFKPPQNDSFLSIKEHYDLELFKQLRRIGKITYCDIIMSVELVHDVMRIPYGVALSSLCNNEVGSANF